MSANYGWPKADGDTRPHRLDGKHWVGPLDRPRIVAVHYDYGDAPFCGSVGHVLTENEAEVTCKRCHHKIGIQDVAVDGSAS